MHRSASVGPTRPRRYAPEHLEARRLLAATLVADVNATTASANPALLTEAGGGVAYFFADSGAYGRELWRSDGTPGGTRLVRDIRPGPEPSNTIGGISGGAPPGGLTVMLGNTLLFAADNGASGMELFRSDGTEAGTVLVKDIAPFGAPSVPNRLTRINATTVLFFATDFETSGTEVWRTDGTEAGTYLVEDAYPGTAWSVQTDEASAPVAFGGRLIYPATDGTNGVELWTSDGTPGGTGMIADIRTGAAGSSPSGLTVVGDVAYFRANDGVNGTSLWKLDLAGNLTRVKSPLPGASRSPNMLKASGDRLFFTDARADGTGRALWVLNAGATATPVEVADLTSFTSILGFAATGTHFFFTGFEPTTGRELWSSDGTGLTRLTDLAPGDGTSNVSQMASVAGRLYFVGNTGFSTATSRPWVSDGTPQGTYSLGAGALASLGAASFPAAFTQVGPTNVYFNASLPGVGEELFVTDGTPQGTRLAVDVNTDTLSADPGRVYEVGNKLLFAANDGVRGMEWWVTDGMPGGDTHLVLDLLPGAANGVARQDEIALHNGELYFAGGANGDELWKTDGTPGGTLHVRTFRASTGPITGARVQGLTSIGGSLYLFAYGADATSSLWKSDASGANFQALQPLGTGSSSGSRFVELNGELYFSANTSSAGTELWKTNGTAAGTVLVRDIFAGNSSYPAHLTRFGNHVYFAAEDGSNDVELWRTDGTSAGTQLVYEFDPRTTWGGSPRGLAVYNGALYFHTNGSTGVGDGFGPNFWKSDGTTAGTVLIKHNPITTGGYTASGNTTVSGGRLYFTAQDDQGGLDVWVSDGTPDGTRPLIDLPNSGSNTRGVLTDVDGVLYFVANNSVYRTSGTAATTSVVATFGPSAVAPQWIAQAKGKVYFAGDDVLHGRELWVETPPAVPPAWLAPGSAATWDAGAKTLTVTGAATITADPGADAPVITANGTAAVLTINPSAGRAVHIGGLTLTGGATATLTSVTSAPVVSIDSSSDKAVRGGGKGNAKPKAKQTSATTATAAAAARTAANSRVLVVEGDTFNIDADSTLELADNNLILNYSGASPAAGVESMVRAGFNGGDWLGKRITSSAASANRTFALGVANNSSLAVPFSSTRLFAGEAVDATAVLVKFTHRVDLDLDGVITTNDATIFNSNYSEGGAAFWRTGDVDFDGLFTTNDATLFNSFYDETLGAV